MFVVELQAQAAEHIDSAVVLQVGLGVVDKDLVARAIIKRFVLLGGNTQARVDPLVATANRLSDTRCQVVTVIETTAGADLGLEARRTGLALLGDNVDDAARGAAAVNGAGPGKHFDTLDVERRDAVELPRQATGTVLADAVDHHQHIAPAHVLAVVGAPFRCQIEARHQFADGFLEADAGLQLFAQLGLIDHPYGAGNFTDGGAGARCHADFNRLERHGRRRRLCAAQDHRARIAELPAHVAAGQERLQGLGDAVLAFQGLGLHALHVAGGVEQAQSRLIGESGEGFVKRLGWQRQVHFTVLLGAGLGCIHALGRVYPDWAKQRGDGGGSQQSVFETTGGAGDWLERSLHNVLPGKV
ncbi:hypothetical protein D3C84_475840 [compost metagenome]